MEKPTPVKNFRRELFLMTDVPGLRIELINKTGESDSENEMDSISEEELVDHAARNKVEEMKEELKE